MTQNRKDKRTRKKEDYEKPKLTRYKRSTKVGGQIKPVGTPQPSATPTPSM